MTRDLQMPELHKSSAIRYSYLLTTKNCVSTIEKCLKSIPANNDERSEIVVVDSQSVDGTAEILESFANKICLISTKCSRGRGWQIALENARGQYIIQVAGDWILRPLIRDFLSLYHRKYEGIAFLSIEQGRIHQPRFHPTPLFIAPADLIRAAGGWRDLQFGEDYDLWSRLADMGKFRFTNRNPFVVHSRHDTPRSALIKGAYSGLKDFYRFGYAIPWRSRVLPIALLAYVSYLCSRKKIPQFDNPSARIVSRISGDEPFLWKLHLTYNCYVPSSDFVSA